MTRWNAGYVADVEYGAGLFREQAPAHLDLVCLLNGVEPPSRGDDFTWCELGCGQGITANVVAAANPRAVVHAVDFHPAHIAHARAMATTADLRNVTFHERSFEDLADGAGPELPAFDYITLHGVYSWVGPETRRAIVRFLDRTLKPGGVAYVSYNSLSAWAPLLPLQRLLQEYARNVAGNSVEAVRQGMDFAEALQAAGAVTLGGPELLRRVRNPGPLDENKHWTYLAHEYLNAHWQPLLHADVARDMAAADLTYAGAAHVFQNEPTLTLNPAQRALLAGIADPTSRETFADYCGQEGHRCDVFVRGARPLSPQQRDVKLRDLGLAQIAPIALPFTIQGPGGSVVLEERVYGPILAALAEAPRRVGELLDLPAVLESGQAPSPRDLVLCLTGLGVALPVVGDLDGGILPSVQRFNRAQSAAAMADGGAVAFLAASVGGAGLTASAAEAMLHHGLQTGAPMESALLVDHYLGPFQVMAFANNPEELNAEAQRRFALTSAIDHAQRVTLPVWRRLGMV
jgi:SAM-dependent methyltransferase